jgi:Zn-dependent protease
VEFQDYILMLPLWYAVFLLSITAHEAAHALVAKLGGDDTAYLAGQVSMNPVPHLRREPFGTVFVPLLTFLMNSGQGMIGWASAPYDPAWEDRYPRRAALMALAGPAANLALALAAFLVLRVGLQNGLWVYAGIKIDFLVIPPAEEAGILEALGRFLSVTLALNVLLLIFNLVPIWPLDGGSVTAGLLRPARILRDRLRAMPMGWLFGLVAAWLMIDQVYGPVLHWVIGLLT